MNERRWLGLLLLLNLLLGTTYALVTPPFEASDELWHYPMIQHLANGNPLPVQVFDPADAGPWKQQASQPPLYYYFGAALTFWIDTSDMATVRWLNPHVDNGVITPDGNINLAVHDPAANPWSGALLALRLVRLASVLLGVSSVFLTYLLARTITPHRPDLTLGATAAVAFLPMFLFISGAVNSDNLIVPLAALACWLMIRTVQDPPADLNRRFLLTGAVIGLAALTKIPGVGLLALALGTAFVAAWIGRERPGTWSGLLRTAGDTLRLFTLTLLPAAAIAGWWYLRNVQLYGDWRGWSAFIAVLGQRPHPASLAQLWDERWGFLASFWGLFGGINVPYPDWVYTLLNGLLLLAAAGGLVYAVQLLRDTARSWPTGGPQGLLRPVIRLLQLVERHFALVVALLWIGAIIYGLIDWATITWSSQGRLVFYALPFLMIFFILGLAGWLPPRLGRWVAAGPGLLLFALAAYAPPGVIRPAYQPQLGCPTAPMVPVNASYGEQITLVGYTLDTVTLQPGEPLPVTITWRIDAPVDRSWSVFVHLNDPVLQTPIAQRDMFMAQGLRPPSLLAPGTCMQDTYVLTVPSTAIAPADLTLAVGLYDFATNERLAVTGGGDAVTLAQVALEPAPGDWPNATTVNFGDELLLRGYTLEPRHAPPGATLALTLYLEARRALADDYTVTAQVLEDFGGANRRWAAADVAPPEPTSTWAPGEVHAVQVVLPIDAGAPAGIHPLILGIYTRSADGGFANLPLVDDNGRVTNDNLLRLTPVRIDFEMGTE